MSKNKQSLTSQTSTIGSITKKTNPYKLGLQGQAPEIFNTNTIPITYNGFQWSFSSGVSWGRFLSGEPFIIVPPAGVMVTGVSYEGFTLPRLVTGYTSAQTEALDVGITMYVSGSMKNPKPFWEQRDFNFTKNNLGATIFPWNYDERLTANNVARKGELLVKGTLVSFGNSFSDMLFFPVGLSAGDNLVTAKSSFNGSNTLFHRPQGTNKFVRWTNPEMSRMCVEKYGILTAIAVNAGPTYADCYRPPVFWNGASLTDRPLFYRHQMVKNTEDYIIEQPVKDVRGDLIDYQAENILNEATSWNNFVNNMWISTHIPYYSGVAHQLAISGYDLYNSDPNTSMGGYMGGGAKVKDQMIQSVFAPWVTKTNRKKALDKVTQFAIDCWGIPNGSGIFNGDGGYHAAVAHPWIVLLGWLYNRPDITKYYLGSQIQARLAPGYIGGFTLTNPPVPLEYMYKMFLTQDYRQRFKVYGAGITQTNGFTGWVATNPNIPLYHGLTSPSKAASGACGFGWMYKVTGISLAYAYTQTNIEVKSQRITGSFGTVVCHRDTVFRLNGLGPGSNKPGPATLPLQLANNGTLAKKGFETTNDVGGFWSFDSGSMLGMNLEIVSGPGAGATAYRVMKGFNHFIGRGKVEDETEEEGLSGNDLGVIKSLQYPTFILDRDFDAGAPNDQSVIKIYPAKSDEVVWGFSAGGWASDLNEKGRTMYGQVQQTLYQQPSYNNIADEAVIKHYSIHNHLGITEDQFLIDYVKGVYFDENLNDSTRRQKFYGSAYVGSIFSGGNLLGGALVGKMLGITGNQYVPKFVDDLPGMFDDQPEITLDGITLEFEPAPVVYTVQGGSGKTYGGYGKIFDSPKTLLRITAVIDDKIFTEVNQPSLYLLLRDLKVQFGPFLTNNIVVEDREDEEAYKDKVSYYDFGETRTPGDINQATKLDDYVRKLPDFKAIYEYNQGLISSANAGGDNQISGDISVGGVLYSPVFNPITSNQATALELAGVVREIPVNSYLPLQKVKLNFISNTFSMAGGVSIVPFPSASNKVASSYGMKNISRGIGSDTNTLSFTLDPLETAILLNSMYYCIASPRIGTNTWDMPEEYIYDNWEKIDDINIVGNIVKLKGLNLTPGSGTGLFGITTDHKLIFFRYLMDRTLYELPYNIITIPPGNTPSSEFLININSTNYPGFTFNDLFTKHRIEQVKIRNSSGNSGVFAFNFRSATTTAINNDYRAAAYNHFRVLHNNYYELENNYGFPLFSTFVDDPNLGIVDYEFYGMKYNYGNFDTLNSKQYYTPKQSGFSITENSIDPPQGIGFYDLVIHGQTMNIYMPRTPQNLYYITGDVSI